ncbi:unnamed protein product [Ilex paraguariensis]|uniref:Uncharacterized protein n=1 Tax=Ilex paraguariensis TaxID=185542 RepID=A0ABC8S762_9AQUA
MDPHNNKDELQKSVAQQSFAPRIISNISDGVQYHAPEGRDLHAHMQREIPDSANPGSFGCVPVSHPAHQVDNGIQQSDGAAFHLRPPHPSPSNQFSYIQADQRMPSRREIPLPSYPIGFHFVQNPDAGNFHSDHDRMKLAPHDTGESWRFSTASVSGPCYADSASVSYAPHPYTGPPCEPAVVNHRWAVPPQSLNHIGLMPYRPPFECPIPVATRAPNFWQPR